MILIGEGTRCIYNDNSWKYKFVDSLILRSGFSAGKKHTNSFYFLKWYNHIKYSALVLKFQVYTL